MAKWMKVALACLCLVAVIFGVVACQSYLPRRVQGEVWGLELLITGDGEFEILQTLDIRIDGWLYNGMFARNARFEGLFEICEYPFTEDSQANIFFLGNGLTGGWMRYSYMDVDIINRPTLRFGTLGTLHTNRRFSSIAIQVSESERRNDGTGSSWPTNRVIVAPASCSETARAVLEANGIGWLDGVGVVRLQ